MSQKEQPPWTFGGFDPEAEQEIDFSRYARLLVVRWWLLAAGLIVGAVIGWAISLGGPRPFDAAATIYLGQPYSVSGGLLQTLQTNPGTIEAIVQSEDVIRRVATSCKTKPGAFLDVTVTKVKANINRNGLTPIEQITVRARHGKEAACAANAFSHRIISEIGVYARRRIANFKRRIAADESTVTTIKSSIASAQVSTTDKLLFQLQLRNFQEDDIASQQQLLQAELVEAPKLLTAAVPEQVPAPSRRNTLVVAALIGLVLGVLAALFWDRVPLRRPHSDEE